MIASWSSGVRSRSVLSANWILVSALGAAGLVHVTIGPEHLTESALIGSGMIGSGIAQLALAAAVRRGVLSTPLAVIVIVLNVGLVGAWLAAVTVGLPVDQHSHAHTLLPASTAHIGPGHVEAVTPAGVATAGLELVAVAGVWAQRLRHGSWDARRQQDEQLAQAEDKGKGRPTS